MHKPQKVSEKRRRQIQRWQNRNKERVIRNWKRYNKLYVARICADPVLHARRLRKHRQYMKKHPEKNRQAYLRRDKKKVRCRGRVTNRIYRGTLKRGSCEVCGNRNTHAHHDDYSKPLEIKWLCHKHHVELHRKLKAVSH